MISRVADYCFWLGRYLERVESTARVLTVTRALSLDGHLTQEQCWLPVLIVSGIEPAYVETFGREGVGIFPIPSVVEREVARQYGVRVVGRLRDVRERFYAISAERRLKHPAVVAISSAAKAELFG